MDSDGDPRRRTVVGLAGLVGMAVTGPLVAACGAEPAPDRAADPEPTQGSTPRDSPSATPDDEPSATGRPARPLVAATDVPVGGGAILSEDRVVVTQPSKGQFLAFSAVCTHQGCIVASVNDRQIVCYCHGSRFGIADGAVERGPATKPLREIPVEVDGGQVRRA